VHNWFGSVIPVDFGSIALQLPVQPSLKSEHLALLLSSGRRTLMMLGVGGILHEQRAEAFPAGHKAYGVQAACGVARSGDQAEKACELGKPAGQLRERVIQGAQRSVRPASPDHAVWRLLPVGGISTDLL